MYGFTIYIANNPWQAHREFDYQQIKPSVYVHHLSNQVLGKENYYVADQDEVFGLDGAWVNLETLKKSHACSDKELIRKWNQNELHVESVMGEFAVFYHNSANELYIKTNPNGTKPWFYYRNKKGLIVSNSLKQVAALAKELNWSLTLNETAALELLSFGFVLGGKTLLAEVNKLTASQTLFYCKQQLVVKTEQHYSKITYRASDIKKHTAEVYEQLKENVNKLYQFNANRQFQQCATLSGGLDARLNVLLAKQLNFSIDKTMAMGQSGHADIRIARQVATFLKTNHHEEILDAATHLKQLTSCVQANDGQVIYAGAAHLHHMFKKLNVQTGVIHTGQMGNVVGGGQLSVSHERAPNLHGKAYANRFLDKLTPVVNTLMEQYNNEEHAKISERVFNGVNNGFWATEFAGYYSSPFLQANTISLLLSIPPEDKYQYRLYFNLINTHVPEMKKWPWDRTGLKPGNMQSLALGKWKSRVNKLWHEVVLGNYSKSSMNPYKHWEKTISWLPSWLNEQCEIQVLDKYPETKEMATTIMQRGNLLEQTQVLTLIHAIKWLVE